MAEHNDYGRLSEKRVVKYLVEKRYKILAKNYRFHNGEVDIIVKETSKVRKNKNVLMSKETLKEDVIVFVEVKARHSAEYGTPSEAVGETKRRKYNLVATEYMQEKGFEGMPFRFDIVEVLGDTVTNHIENGF